MKIMLVCLEDEKEKTGQIRVFLEKTGIPVETLLIKSDENALRNMEKQFTSLFIKSSGNEAFPTHVAVFSALAPGYVDFLAGFSCGSNIPFLVCGEKAIACFPEVLAFCFKPFQNEKALETYISTENDNYHKQKASGKAEEARQKLLSMGVPVTEEAAAQCAAGERIVEVSLFLEAGFSPDTKNKSGVPLLNIAARNGCGEIIKVLLRSGAHVDLAADDRGSTALIDSAMGKHINIVKDLIEAGANPNMRSKSGQTALVVAVGADDEETASVLIKAGADPEIEDNMGVSARKYAVLFRKSAMLALFDGLVSGKTV